MYHCSKSRVLAVVVLTTVMRCAWGQVIVDDFDPVDHSHDFTFGSSEYVNRSFVRVFNGPMLGIERDVEYFQEIATNAAGRPQFFTKYQVYENLGNTEYFSLGAYGPGSSLGRAKGYIEMQYDRNGDEVDNTGFDRHLRNGGTGQPFFLGDHYGIRVRNASEGASPVNAVMTLRQQGSILASVSGVLGGTTLFRDEDFLFPVEVMRLADSVTLRVNLDVGGSSERTVYIDRIETIVPEPSSLVLFGLSGLYLIVTRKRKCGSIRRRT